MNNQKTYLFPLLIIAAASVFVYKLFSIAYQTGIAEEKRELNQNDIIFQSESCNSLVAEKLKDLELQKKSLEIQLAMVELQIKYSVIQEAEKKLNNLIKRQQELKDGELISEMESEEAAKIIED
jgi:hypothetical protein